MLLQKRYHLVKPIGRGGFGKTFLAMDEGQSPASVCAVKQLLPQNQSTRETGNLAFQKQEFLGLFQQQAQWLEELGKHPQIPSLLAYFEEDGCLYLVHEFIDGSNLAQVVEEEGTFSEAEIWQFLQDSLPILKFIRDRHVIHRDIKPANIIRRNSDNRLVLVDFSAAKLATNIEWMSTETNIGSPEYVAPEQMRGKAVFASDLYSLGVTCIYLLTGISPFDLFDATNDRWAWQQYAIAQVSDRLSNILDKLLQNAVNQRFQSADEVMLAINPTSCKYNPLNVQGRSSLASTPSQPWQCYRTLAVPSLLKSVNSVATNSDGQLLASGNDDKTIRLWNLETGQATGTLSGHVCAVRSVAFTPQGHLLASGSDDRTIKLWQVSAKQEFLTLTGHSHAVKSVAFSPDGQLLASGSWDKTIKLWDVNTGKELFTLTGHRLQVSAIAFSPDGQFLASASFDRTVRLYSLYSSEHFGLSPQFLYALTGHDRHVLCVAFSPNGKAIATASDDNTVKLWDINTGQVLLTLLGHSWSVVTVAFSPDGETLVTGSWDKTVKLWKASTGQEICTLSGHSDSVCGVTFGFTDQVIASCSKDATVRLWQRV